MDFRTRQAHAIHPFQLKRSINPDLGLGNLKPTFQLKGIANAPAIFLLGHTSPLRHLLREKQGWGTGIQHKIERPFAVDSRPNHQVLGYGQTKWNLNRLAHPLASLLV